MKPFKTFEEQLDILESRGLIIDIDRNEAISFLRENNYYRLSGYAKLLSNIDTEQFNDGTTFSCLRKIYIFDFDFRRVLNDLMEEVEITVRTQIAYNLARTLSPGFYIKKEHFFDEDQFNSFIDEINHAKERNSKNLIVVHHKGKVIPIWAMVELLSFGTISRMYSNLLNKYKSAVSKNDFYSMPHKAFRNYLYVSSQLRNKCAHRGRIYGKYLNVNFSISKEDTRLFDCYSYPRSSQSTTSIFQAIFAAFKLLNNKDSVNRYIDKIQFLFDNYNDCIDPNILGFYDNWDDVLRGF